jgi:hypothetical protein
MKLRLFLLLLIAVPVVARAQVKFLIYADGLRAGEAFLTQKFNADGGKTVEMRLETFSMARPVTVRQTSTYNAKGIATRKIQEIVIPSLRMRRTVIAEFDQNGARAILDRGNGRKVLKAPLVEGSPRFMSSEFWFLKEQPPLGAQLLAYNFNLENLEWDVLETTYVEKIAISRLASAHKVTVRNGDRTTVAFFDEEGGLLWFEDSNGYRLERVSAGS